MPSRLAHHLMTSGLVPASQVDAVMRRLESSSARLDTLFLERGLLSEAGALQALSDACGVRLVNLADFEANVEVGQAIPQTIAERLLVVPLSEDDTTLHIACAYPLPTEQLKEVGVLLGRPIEVWVALECRVRDWLRQLYGTPLAIRYELLLQSFDPTRARLPAGAGSQEQSAVVKETLSEEVLARIAQGIVEEPVVLKKRRKPSAPAPAASAPPADEGRESTVIIDAGVLQAFANPTGAAKAHEREETRIVSSGYQQFAKEVTRTPGLATAHTPEFVRTDPENPMPSVPTETWQVTPNRAPLDAPLPGAFPGGVLPPPKGDADRSFKKRGPNLPIPWVTPARAVIGRVSTREELPMPMPLPVAAPAHAAQALAPPLTANLTEEAASASSMEGALDAAAVARGDTPPPEPSVPTDTSPLDAWSLEEAREGLFASVNDREALLDVLLTFGLKTFEWVAAFAVVRGAALGWDGRGNGDVSSLRQLAVPLDVPSLFHTVAVTRGNYVGPVPADVQTVDYLAAMGRKPRAVFMFPVEVQGKLVALLYADTTTSVSQRRLAEFLILCQQSPDAFEALILWRKQSLGDTGAFTQDAAYGGLAEAVSQGEGLSQEGADAAWADPLLRSLVGPDANARIAAMSDLLQYPEAAAQALASAFPGPSGWTRLPVGELPDADELGPIPGALARLGGWGASALVPLLSSQNSDVRYLALLTAGSIPSPDLVEGVMQALFDEEPDVSSAARAAATRFKDVAAFHAALPTLRDELFGADALRSSLAAKALGVLHDRASVEALITMTGHGDELCAQSAKEALLETTRHAEAATVHDWRAWWAAHQNERRIDWLLQALSSSDFDARLSSIEELSKLFGDNHGYFVNGPEQERAAAIAKWRKVVASRPDVEA